MYLIGFLPGILAGVVQPFGETALLQELLFQLAQELIQQVVCLVNQADQCVGSLLG